MNDSREGSVSCHSRLPAAQKPAQICGPGPNLSEEPDGPRWAERERERIAGEVAAITFVEEGRRHTLRIRNAEPDDFDRVDALIQRCFGNSFPASGYQVLWSLRCGRGAVIETEASDLVAVHLETPAADEDHSSYSIGACVDPRVRGHRLSGTIARYTGLSAFMDGARVRRGIVAPTNLGSCLVLLHEVGANFVRFHRSFANFAAPRIEYALELSPAGLGSQRVDQSALASWLRTGPTEVELVATGDYGRLVALLEDRGRHVVALCREQGAYVVAPRV
ncbi:MAG: hypothetical protein KC431_14925 [Myxococcales bacterium]|nr:hypothetical protein [Myxococcales bacterium]